MIESEMLAAFKPSQRSLERASLKDILISKLWACFLNTIFRWSWRFNGVRLMLMRAFGAKIAVVGAGAVVAKNVVPWTVVAGNPARVIKKREIKI